MNNGTNAAVAFQIDHPGTRFLIEDNTAEGKAGVKDATVQELKRNWEE